MEGFLGFGSYLGLFLVLMGVACTGFVLFAVGVAMFHIGRLAGGAAVSSILAPAASSTATGVPISGDAQATAPTAGSARDSRDLAAGGGEDTLPPVSKRAPCVPCARIRSFFGRRARTAE